MNEILNGAIEAVNAANTLNQSNYINVYYNISNDSICHNVTPLSSLNKKEKDMKRNTDIYKLFVVSIYSPNQYTEKDLTVMAGNRMIDYYLGNINILYLKYLRDTFMTKKTYDELVQKTEESDSARFLNLVQLTRDNMSRARNAITKFWEALQEVEDIGIIPEITTTKERTERLEQDIERFTEGLDNIGKQKGHESSYPSISTLSRLVERMNNTGDTIDYYMDIVNEIYSFLHDNNATEEEIIALFPIA